MGIEDDKWIPIGEIDLLPKKACHILVWGSYTRDCPLRSMECIFYPKNNPKYNEFRNMDGSRTKNITHYQPLPSAPKKNHE